LHFISTLPLAAQQKGKVIIMKNQSQDKAFTGILRYLIPLVLLASVFSCILSVLLNACFQIPAEIALVLLRSFIWLCVAGYLATQPDLSHVTMRLPLVFGAAALTIGGYVLKIARLSLAGNIANALMALLFCLVALYAICVIINAQHVAPSIKRHPTLGERMNNVLEQDLEENDL
jgi:vacuolar-type H+-ATPase subunit I/STV1